VAVAPRATLAERFHARHRERYGFDEPGGEIEVVSVRRTTARAGPALQLPRMPRTAPVRGPAPVPLDGATIWVGEGWTARRRPDGSWRLTR
jgi:N-methylhydantoinase A